MIIRGLLSVHIIQLLLYVTLSTVYEGVFEHIDSIL